MLRGGSEQFIDEADRSLHDAIMIVRRALKHAQVVPGGGAIEMEVRVFVVEREDMEEGWGREGCQAVARS